jgi:hypothetical protein
VRSAATVPVPPDHLQTRLMQQAFGTFARGLVDVRRYNRLGPDGQLNLRVVAGGALDGSALPPQRQHALGGLGSLPGLPLFGLSCGSRVGEVVYPADGQPDGPLGGQRTFLPGYGCDGFGLVQAEYRGTLRFRFDVGRWADRYEPGASDRGWEDELTWVLFTDYGRVWSHAIPAGAVPGDRREALDVGAGLLFDQVGVYGAVPLVGGRGLRVFLRLQPRF